MRRMVGAAMVVAFGLALGAGNARAHDDDGDAHEAQFRATLVADADAGDFGVGSGSGSFVTIEAAGGGRVRMALAGVTDAGGMPAAAPGCQLTVTGLVDGAPFVKAFAFDLAAGTGAVDDTLGLADASLFEVQTVTVSSPATGVFAVPGIGSDDGDDGDHDDGDDNDDDGDDDHDGEHGHGGGHRHGWGRHGHDHLTAAQRHGRGRDCDGRHGGHGKLATSLVGDFDAGDYGVDSTMGGFLSIEADEGGEVEMRIAGVTDAMGQPVSHAGNQLVVTGARNGVPFTATFPFDLVDGAGEVEGMLAGMDGDLVEIHSIALTDGAVVFAVPGFLVRGTADADLDGVPDGDDACAGTGADVMVGHDGCSLRQRCGCGGGRRALRACLRGAAKDIRKAKLQASCAEGQRCRRPFRRLVSERRSVLRSCGGGVRR